MLVRYHLIEPVSRRRRRDQYRRWERSAAMELWQMDMTASLFLAEGRECKVITGIDGYSRFCVIATVVARATGRAVCLAFTTAMAEYGIPAEVLSDIQAVFVPGCRALSGRRCEASWVTGACPLSLMTDRSAAA